MVNSNDLISEILQISVYTEYFMIYISENLSPLCLVNVYMKRGKVHMKITVAIDSLKESLSSMEAGYAIKNGITKAIPDAEVFVRPIADGGEGTVEAISVGMNGDLQEIQVTNPIGKSIICNYCILKDTHTAIIEISAAAGLMLISNEERNPLYTTTYGVGEIILDAIAKGCRNFIVGLGGSATNDGGIGMLQALGFGMLNSEGDSVPFGASGLKELTQITTDNAVAELKDCVFKIACDVTNPLVGEQGCSAVYGPQKNADPKMIHQMDNWLHNYANLVKNNFKNVDPDYPGAGAAGGLGFAFLTFLNSNLQSGIDLILEMTSLESYIKEADIVVTGEGRLDGQTIQGKAPAGVAKIAKQHNKLVIAFSGAVTKDARACNTIGIDAFFPILREVDSLKNALNPINAANNMTDTSEQVFRLIDVTWKKDH